MFGRIGRSMNEKDAQEFKNAIDKLARVCGRNDLAFVLLIGNDEGIQTAANIAQEYVETFVKEWLDGTLVEHEEQLTPDQEPS